MKTGKSSGTRSLRFHYQKRGTDHVSSALSEILDHALPYDDVLALRDRMWELSPSLVRYDTLEHTSPDIASVGLKALAAHTLSAKVSGVQFRKPITNFYQTDPISRACVLPFFFSFFFGADQRRGGTDVQVSDHGTVYTSVCQRRALRIGKVVTGCVCITQRPLRAEVEHRVSIDGFPSTKKINTFLYCALLSPCDSKVGPMCNK